MNDIYDQDADKRSLPAKPQPAVSPPPQLKPSSPYTALVVLSLLAGLPGLIFFRFGIGWTIWSWLWAAVWASANASSRKKQELQYETNLLLWEAANRKETR